MFVELIYKINIIDKYKINGQGKYFDLSTNVKSIILPKIKEVKISTSCGKCNALNITYV